MKFSIFCENGSGCYYESKEDFLKEILYMIDDCIASGGNNFSVEITADASCYFNPEEDN